MFILHIQSIITKSIGDLKRIHLMRAIRQSPTIRPIHMLARLPHAGLTKVLHTHLHLTLLIPCIIHMDTLLCITVPTKRIHRPTIPTATNLREITRSPLPRPTMGIRMFPWIRIKAQKQILSRE